MKKTIINPQKTATKKVASQHLTVGELERRYLEKMRRKGVKFSMIPTKSWDDDVYNYAIAECEKRQISLTEFVQEALLRTIGERRLFLSAEALAKEVTP